MSGINISEIAKDFILKCLTFDQDKRISWAEIYKHPLITADEKVKYGLEASNINFQKNISFYEKKYEVKDVKDWNQAEINVSL